LNTSDGLTARKASQAKPWQPWLQHPWGLVWCLRLDHEAPPDNTLPNGQNDWMVFGDAGLDAAALPQAVQARAQRFVHARDTQRYLASHRALHAVLATQGHRPKAEDWDIGPHGQPLLRHGPRFNLSRRGGWVAIVLGTNARSVGIDVENHRAIDGAEALAQQHFTLQERAELAAASAQDQSRVFLRGWTRKEAVVKALGSGLSIAPVTYQTGLAPATARTTVATPQGLMVVETQTIADGEIIVALARVDRSA
jgi:4'-phosphopantetheinyl transferase